VVTLASALSKNTIYIN